MANIEGMQDKFVVIKRTDISEFLPPVMKAILQEDILRAIDVNQIMQQVKPASEKTYLVINTDEPYADEIIAILKRHGHWGSPDPFPIPEGRCISCGADNQSAEHIDNCDPEPIERDED